MEELNKIQNEIIEDFSLFDNQEDKYNYIIELGKSLNTLQEEYKTEDNRIKGCQSNVWMHSTLENGKVFFKGDSDSMIVKGLVSLLIKVLSNQNPEDIANSDLFFLEKIGMNQLLTMRRANGLASMIKQMKLYGLAYQGKVTS